MSQTSMLQGHLKYFPINMFSCTMGLAGFTISAHKMKHVFGTDDTLSQIFAYFTLIVFCAILVTYLLKFIRHRAYVIAEWQHPTRINFFPAASISLLLLGAAFYPINETLSFYLWLVGTFTQFFLSMSIIKSWVNNDRFQVTHSSPSWFIPVVGNIMMPIAGIHHAPIELSWFFFSWGLMFWIVLLTFIFYRMVFHSSLPDKYVPTLFIFLSPPAIGFVSYMALVGDLDIMGRLIYYAAMFFFIFLMSQANHFVRIKFNLSWWAYTFPLAAFTSATKIMANQTGLEFFQFSAQILFVCSFVQVFTLTFRTLIGQYRGEFCQKDD